MLEIPSKSLWKTPIDLHNTITVYPPAQTDQNVSTSLFTSSFPHAPPCHVSCGQGGNSCTWRASLLKSISCGHGTSKSGSKHRLPNTGEPGENDTSWCLVLRVAVAVAVAGVATRRGGAQWAFFSSSSGAVDLVCESWMYTGTRYMTPGFRREKSSTICK